MLGWQLTLQLGAGQVDGGSMGGRPRADNNYFAVHVFLGDVLDLARIVVLLEGSCCGSD